VFLTMLDSDEKRAFTRLAERLIEADGIVIGREATALASLRAEMGLGAAGGDRQSDAELARVFGSRRSRIAALLELFGLAYSDTDFEPGEASLITAVARAMDVTPEELAAVDGWVRDHVALVRRALVLMRE
jgi:hypothetical protein